MSDRNPQPAGGLKLLVPFLVGDALLLGSALLIFWQAHRPMTPVEVIVVATCTALGAFLGAWPFVLQFRAGVVLAETERLTDSVAQIQQVELVADRIANATAQWQTAQDHSTRAVNAAREIAERMDREARDFLKFFEQTDTAEKAHLRLEVEKLRRGEKDWLQVLVRILDHVYALQQAAARSGKPNVAGQIAAFQDACRDAARRIGLVPVVPAPDTPFDPRLHQPLDPNAPMPQWPVIAQVVGTGYNFQGQPLRPIVVVLKSGAPPNTEAGMTSPGSGSDGAMTTPADESSAPLTRAVETAADSPADYAPVAGTPVPEPPQSSS
jgi:molecular chaperone GrpE (heat shock protein)